MVLIMADFRGGRCEWKTSRSNILQAENDHTPSQVTSIDYNYTYITSHPVQRLFARNVINTYLDVILLRYKVVYNTYPTALYDFSYGLPFSLYFIVVARSYHPLVMLLLEHEYLKIIIYTRSGYKVFCNLIDPLLAVY